MNFNKPLFPPKGGLTFNYQKNIMIQGTKEVWRSWNMVQAGLKMRHHHELKQQAKHRKPTKQKQNPKVQ